MGNLRNIAFWFVLFILLLMLFRLFAGDVTGNSSRTTTYSDFVKAVDNGQVTSATLDGETVSYTGPNDVKYTTIVPGDARVSDLLVAKGVSVVAKSQKNLNFPIYNFIPFTNYVTCWRLDLFYEPNARWGQRRGNGLW